MGRVGRGRGGGGERKGGAIVSVQLKWIYHTHPDYGWQPIGEV